MRRYTLTLLHILTGVLIGVCWIAHALDSLGLFPTADEIDAARRRRHIIRAVSTMRPRDARIHP